MMGSVITFAQTFRRDFLTAIDRIRYRAKKQREILYAFYDLAVSPADFGFTVFLVLAELRRQKLGCASTHIVIVPASESGFRKGDLEGYQKSGAEHFDIHTMRWRLRNILVPCCWLIPSCQQVTVCASREEAMTIKASIAEYSFPENYNIRFPRARYPYSQLVAATLDGNILPSFRPTLEACRHIARWIQKHAAQRRVIAITLRESPYRRGRNSSLKDWANFARSLDPEAYWPVFIRDTEAAFGDLPPELNGLAIFPDLSWNVELRAAFYELSYLNMSVNTGPNMLFILNRRTRYLCFKLVEASSGETEDAFRSYGIEPGSQLVTATPLQRFVWNDDRLGVLQETFKEMCDRIEIDSRDSCQAVGLTQERG